jgi:hypothetical protein
MASLSGLALAEAFYVEAVRPIVERVCPRLRHSAARIGQGSEVLGYGDEISQDHDWGPRLELFVDPPDAERHRQPLVQALAEDLPRTFRGYSTSFAPDADGVGVLVETEPGALVTHRVEIHDVGGWCQLMLGFDPRRYPWGETSEHLVAIGLGTSLDDALAAAVRHALTLVRDQTGIAEAEALAFLSAAADFEISQAVNGVRGVHCLIRKADLVGA